MATEVAFAKSFLTLIDSKPTKITADHVEDARNYPATIPVCVFSRISLGGSIVLYIFILSSVSTWKPSQ